LRFTKPGACSKASIPRPIHQSKIEKMDYCHLVFSPKTTVKDFLKSWNHHVCFSP